MDYLKKNPIIPSAPILVMAGDITLFKYLDEHKHYFKILSEQFEAVYWLPGNHEYYQYDLANKMGSFKEKIFDNVFLLNNQTVNYKGYTLIFSELWSKISPLHQIQIEKSLNDFNLIKYNGNRLTTEVYNQNFEESFAFIKQEVAKNEAEKVLVFTHVVPTLKNYPEKYINDPINEAFTVDLTSYIEPSNIKAWVYGHSHFNTPNFMLGNTQMLTNQLCYVKWNEHGLFNNSKIISL